MLFLVYPTSDGRRRLSRSRLLVCFQFLSLLIGQVSSSPRLDHKKVLKHHPDKKVAPASANATTTTLLQFTGTNTNDDSFFKCVSKANEVLTHPEKRRQFDSVDPKLVEWEEDLPSSSIKVSGERSVLPALNARLEQGGRFFPSVHTDIRDVLALLPCAACPWSRGHGRKQGRGGSVL